MRTYLYLILALILMPFPIFADDARPAWTLKPQKEDALWKYYVGRASGAVSEREAITDATRNAMTQAIQQNFGVRVKVEAQSQESLKNIEFSRHAEEITEAHEIYDFEMTESYIHPHDGIYDAWVLYRYKKTAIGAEKGRLANLKSEQSQRRFSEIGKVEDAAQGILEVTTVPPGATVYIDDERVTFMETPLRLMGRLAPGPHTISVDHTDYDGAQGQVTIVPGKTIRFDRILRRGTGRLKIETQPANATVFSNGKIVCTSPCDSIDLPAGIPLKLQMTHPETESYVEELTVEKNKTRAITRKLPYKTGRFSLASIPAGLKITWDGQLLTDSAGEPLRTPVKNISVEGGEHELTLEAPLGYSRPTKKVYIKGGSHTPINDIKLEIANYAIRDSNYDRLQLEQGLEEMKTKGFKLGE